MTIISERLAKALELTDSLAAELASPALTAHNGSSRSNTIGQQFWCIVGARESYTRAFDAGQWQGFACSLNTPHEPEAVRGALAETRAELTARLAEPSNDRERETVLAELLEHEVQHHGQLIRYFYANELPFPPAFAARYAL